MWKIKTFLKAEGLESEWAELAAETGPSPNPHAALHILPCARGLRPVGQWFPLYSFQNTYTFSSHKPLSHRCSPSHPTPQQKKQNLSNVITRWVGSRAWTRTPVIWLDGQSSSHDIPQIWACTREPQARWYMAWSSSIWYQQWEPGEHLGTLACFLICVMGWWPPPVDVHEQAGEMMRAVTQHLAGVQHSVVPIHATDISQQSQCSSFHSRFWDTKDGQEELQLPKSCQCTGEPGK